VVVAAAQELREVVVRPERAVDRVPDRAFASSIDAELAVEPDRLGDVEQRRLVVGTDRREHRSRLGVGVRRVWAAVTSHGTVMSHGFAAIGNESPGSHPGTRSKRIGPWTCIGGVCLGLGDVAVGDEGRADLSDWVGTGST